MNNTVSKIVENLKLNESVVLTPDEFGDKYEELYDKMMAERRRLGSQYGSIGQKKSNKFEDALDEIDDLLDYSTSNSDDTREIWKKLPDSYQDKVINVFKKVGIRV